MDSNPKKKSRLIEFLILLLVIICTTLILVEVYTNVVSELHGALTILGKFS
jgi:hypothetical protein